MGIRVNREEKGEKWREFQNSVNGCRVSQLLKSWSVYYNEELSALKAWKAPCLLQKFSSNALLVVIISKQAVSPQIPCCQKWKGTLVRIDDRISDKTASALATLRPSERRRRSECLCVLKGGIGEGRWWSAAIRLKVFLLFFGSFKFCQCLLLFSAWLLRNCGKGRNLRNI